MNKDRPHALDVLIINSPSNKKSAVGRGCRPSYDGEINGST